MAQLAIKGHATRGSEVIELLEMLGGINSVVYRGSDETWAYFISMGKDIDCESYNSSSKKCFTLEEFLEKFPYKVGDKVWVYDNNFNAKITETITRMRWHSESNCILFDVNVYHNLRTEDLQPYKEETMKEPKELLIGFIKDENGNMVLNTHKDYEIKEVNGKFMLLKKYPKTYEECFELMDTPENKLLPRGIYGYKANLLSKLQQLFICRDAYWKIAGNWKPNFGNDCDTKYVIATAGNEIYKDESIISNYVLIFPTEEIRDAFYDNFKDLIEQCKELL